MTGQSFDPAPQGAADPDPPRATASERSDVFGDVLPDQTTDERSEDADWREDEQSDERLRREVPPHH